MPVNPNLRKIGATKYHLHSFRGKKHWLRPRLLQELQLLICRLDGHSWSDWQIDDMEGPMAFDDYGAYPMTARPSQPGEFGIRVCRRLCGTVERRMPVESNQP